MWVIVYRIPGDDGWEDWQVYAATQGEGEAKLPLIVRSQQSEVRHDARTLASQYPKAEWGIAPLGEVIQLSWHD